MTPGKWGLLPDFILRSTGFPFHLLSTLALQETVVAVDELLEIEERLQERRGALEEAVRRLRAGGAPLPPSLRSCARRIEKGLTVDEATTSGMPPELTGLLEDWNRTVEAKAAAESRARAAYEDELLDRRQQLRAQAGAEQFGEACFLSSPQMYAHGVLTYLRDWQTKRTSDLKRLERQLISYLQRFCAKNETTSFFGPINYGHVGRGTSRALNFRRLPGTARRDAFLAYWGVQVLSARISSDPSVRPMLRPRRSPLCVPSHEGSVRCHGPVSSRVFAAHTTAARILLLADGSRTLNEITRVLEAEGCTRRQWETDVEQLCKNRLLTVQLDLPVTSLNALSALHASVVALPEECTGRDRWISELQEIAGLVHRFAQGTLAEKESVLANLEARFRALSETEPRRGAGALYADRLLVYEEALGALTPVEMGESLYQHLAKGLSPALNLGAFCGVAQRQAAQAQVRHTFSRLSPDGVPIPLVRLLGAFAGPEQAAVGEHRQEQVMPAPMERILALIRPHADERVIRVDPSQLNLDSSELPTDGYVASPDVMLYAVDLAALERDEFTAVLGECHDTAMLWGWALAFHPDSDGVQTRVGKALAAMPSRAPLANVLTSKRVKIVPFEFPGYTVEIQARSAKGSDECIPLADVWVAEEDGELVLSVPERGLTLALYNGELRSPVHTAFALPRCVPPTIDLGEHTPRLLLGDLVYQRERWRLKREQVLPATYNGASFNLFLDLRRAVRRYGFPQFLFVRVEGESKPFCLDTSNPFLVELLDHFLKPTKEAVFTEMFPPPEGLWLEKDDGRYCSEFRLCAFHTADETTGGGGSP